MRICRCGDIVKDRCPRCDGSTGRLKKHYDYKHRVASETYRAIKPLCERCVMLHGAVNANLSKDMHHIVKITKSEHLKMEQSNWLALCVECHEALEKDELEGMKTKQWSDLHYEEALNART